MARPRKYYVFSEHDHTRIIEGCAEARKVYASGSHRTRLDAEEAASWLQYDRWRYVYTPRRASPEPTAGFYYRPGEDTPYLTYTTVHRRATRPL